MERGAFIFGILIIVAVRFIIYHSIPSKHAKFEESFAGYVEKSLVTFEYKKSPLHTVVYGGSGTGKTYFVQQYNLFEEEAREQKRTIVVCKDVRDWINTETGEVDTIYILCVT